MYKSFQLVVLLCVVLLAGGCSRSKKNDDADKIVDTKTIVIDGVVTNGHAEMLYLQRLDVDTLGTPFRNYESVSNSKIEGGKFSMSYTPVTAGPAFYRISDGKGNFIITVASPGDKLKFSFPVGDTLCLNYKVSGGADALLMCELDNRFTQFIDSVDYLTLLYQLSDDDETHVLINNAYSLIKGHHADYLRHFIQLHSNSLPAISAFYQKYQNGTFFDEQRDLNLLETISMNLSQKHPKNACTIWLRNRIETVRPIVNENLSNNQ